MIKLILIGNGKLADAIQKGFHQYSDIPLVSYTPGIEADRSSLFVHVGSGRQYNAALQQAISVEAAFIQAATEKKIPLDSPVHGRFRFVHAPNLDLHIIKLFYCLKKSGSVFKGEKISLLESHQQEKTSVPGTAVKFCDYLKIPRDSIQSVRDPEEQKKLPISNLDHHAFHRIQIGEDDSSLTIETRIEGAESYVRGLARIVEAVRNLKDGLYEIDDLVEKGLL